jgi:hypothetical protein
MFNRTIQTLDLGPLRRKWGYWQGFLIVPSLRDRLEFRIEGPRKNINTFVDQARRFPAEFERLRPELSVELFHSYQVMREEELAVSTFHH